MRTLVFIVAGVLLAALALRWAPAPQRTRAAVAFTLAWLGIAVWNLRTGLAHGYTLAEELPIHVVLFGLPVACAWGVWRCRRR